MGIWATRKPRSWRDGTVNIATNVVYAMPELLMAMLALLVFAVYIPIITGRRHGRHQWREMGRRLGYSAPLGSSGSGSRTRQEIGGFFR
ncbi:MAG: hypothetical protein HY525_14475 [Betaproteobacteria bacterium]|nr:hypothetical protein [Betaproteobacteria bacterium]